MPMSPFSQSCYASNMEMSSTLAVLMEAERLRAAGADLVDLGAGEPDFPTPANVKQAAERAIEENFTRYTATGGAVSLKRAILEMMERDFGAIYNLSELLVTAGGKQAIFNAMASLLNPGDEVLIPRPYWVTFPEITKFLRAVPVFIDTEERGFVLDADMVRDSITPRTKLLILNSPNNPTGRVIPPDEFRRIVEAAAERGVLVISDECYLQFVYPPGRPFTAGQLPDDLRRSVMVCGSFSKAYAMTGWRVGFALGREDWIQPMLKIQSHSTSNVTSISQRAAEEAAQGQQDSLKFMLQEYQKRRDWLIPALNRIQGIECLNPEGAFYAFPKITGLLGETVRNSTDFSRLLLEQALVVVTPGSSFGAEDYVRISYANSLEAIQRGVERISEAAAALNSRAA